MYKDEIIYIYALIDPRNYRIRYVGRTNNINRRYKQHCREKSSTNHRTTWLKMLRTLNLKPLIFVIEECNNLVWAKREQFFIQYYKQLGCNLTNSTDGGDGSIGLKHTEETKLKMRKPKNRQTIYSRNRGGAKLTIEQIKEIKTMILEGYKGSYIARLYNISRANVNLIKLGKIWKDIDP